MSQRLAVGGCFGLSTHNSNRRRVACNAEARSPAGPFVLCSRFGAVTAPTIEHTRQLVRRSLHRKPATQHAPGSRHTSGHQLLLADRTVTAAVTEVLAANPDATLFDIEMAFRDVGARAYGIAGPNPRSCSA